MSQAATTPETAARAEATPKQISSMRKLAGAIKAIGRAKGTEQHNGLAVNAYTLLKDGRGASFAQARYYLDRMVRAVGELKELPEMLAAA
ncbi:MAG: hypothetical protein M3418_09055 [Gemmatimonadota bacterium]|nr:hypothetical protein [Gemmatimonadota bacterium]MDQ3606313.1 hypothetical protein [Gemmatimonadota bacterium]